MIVRSNAESMEWDYSHVSSTLCVCYLSYCLSNRGESTDEEFVTGLLPCDSSGEELTDVRYYVLLLDDSGGLYSNSSTM